MAFSFFKKLFGGAKPDINAVSLKVDGWEVLEDDAQKKVWRDQNLPGLLSVNFFNLPPDIPSLSSTDELRAHYRKSIQKSGMGVLKIEVFDLKGILAVETIFKQPLPQQTGLAYVGAITIPFRQCSYVIKIESVEVGVTGVRETMVTNQLLTENSNLKNNSLQDAVSSWTYDPYDPSLKEGFLMNKSEEEEYDAFFPDHPLTVVRQKLDWIKSEIELSEILHQLEKF